LGAAAAEAAAYDGLSDTAADGGVEVVVGDEAATLSATCTLMNTSHRSVNSLALAATEVNPRCEDERKAIRNAAQRRGLVERTLGGCTVPTLKGEEIS
jgi:hypothetical protein